jgi:hypothetical protein
MMVFFFAVSFAFVFRGIIALILADEHHDENPDEDDHQRLKTPSKGKQLCLPHLVRNLNELKDRYQSKWAHRAKEIFLQIMILCQQNRINKADKIQIEQEIDTLLNRPLKKSKKKVKTFLKRLLKNRKHLTTCLYLRKVPPDNNASERAIRNVKVKQKVSCQFRSFKGANQFAVLRSVFDTTRKNDGKAFDAFFNIALYAPE